MKFSTLVALALSAGVVGLVWTARQKPQGPLQTGVGPGVEPAHVSDPVTDFDRFIATRPLPTEFRFRYPRIELIEPGMPSTREERHDQSRFFADLDTLGRITSGAFY